VRPILSGSVPISRAYQWEKSRIFETPDLRDHVVPQVLAKPSREVITSRLNTRFGVVLSMGTDLR
jgi:hypothetical protein